MGLHYHLLALSWGVGVVVMVTRLLVFVLLTLAFTQASFGQTTTKERRVALVVGNAAYPSGAALATPVKDAEVVAAALRKQGYEITVVTNASRRDFAAALARFEEALRGADSGLFYFAGHGLQVRGENYLVPVDVELSSLSSGPGEVDLLQMRRIQRALQATPKPSLIIIDACRTNPFEAATRSAVSRLAPRLTPTIPLRARFARRT